MHRTIEASIPSDISEAVQGELLKNPHVINLNLIRNASVKPEGDVLIIHVLNRGADEVMRILATHIKNAEFSIVTAELASLNDGKHQKQIDQDFDEAIWEEMETGLRHNGRITENYMLLMGIGGIVAAVGFASEIHNLVIAFVSASIIAPGLEPLAKIPLGIALRKTDVLIAGVKSSAMGYLVLILAAGISFWLMNLTGVALRSDFVDNKVTNGLTEINFKAFLLSFAASAASIVMYLSYRRNVIAGPLITLVLIPTSAAIGICAVLGEWDLAFGMLQRFALDMILVISVGILFILYKQMTVHKRMPVR